MKCPQTQLHLQQPQLTNSVNTKYKTFEEVADLLARSKDENRLKKKGIIPKYPPEMDLVRYPWKFKIPTFQSYSGKWSAYQRMLHFKSHIGGMPNVDALKIKLFIGTLKGIYSLRLAQVVTRKLSSFMGNPRTKVFTLLSQTKYGDNELV